jgi:hypothetical protein
MRAKTPKIEEGERMKKRADQNLRIKQTSRKIEAGKPLQGSK